MELTYDWRGFQSFFYSKRKTSLAQAQNSSPIYLVVEGDQVVSTLSEGEDLSEWVGSTYSEVAAQMTHRELFLFPREQVDQWMKESLLLPHLYDQAEYLRTAAIGQRLTRGRFKRPNQAPVLKPVVHLPVRQHFLLEALQSWWIKALPSAFGIFIRLERNGDVGVGKNEVEREIFLVVRRGKMDLFCEPDLSILCNDRRRQLPDVVKYLSEKFSVPVQGVVVGSEKWNEWSESVTPWKEVLRSLRGGKQAQARLIPSRMGVSFLVSLRGIFGF